MDKIQRIEDDDEEDHKMNELVSEQPKSVELQPMYGRGNAKSGERRPYLLYSSSIVVERVMLLTSDLVYHTCTQQNYIALCKITSLG